MALRNCQLLEQIRHQSLHDPLTDLPNRALLLDRAEQMLARGRRCGTGSGGAVHRPGFKLINGTLGPEVGDQILQAVAGRLASTLRGNDTVGRLGGDEFVVLVDCDSLDGDISSVARRVIEVVREPIYLPGRELPLNVGASIGIAVGDRPSAADLLRDADVALYQAKAAGKGCVAMFEAPNAVTADHLPRPRSESAAALAG